MFSRYYIIEVDIEFICRYVLEMNGFVIETFLPITIDFRCKQSK